MEEENKCSSCVGWLDYKTAVPCRYCKWNKTPYWGRDESKMTEDHYFYVPPSNDKTIPF